MRVAIRKCANEARRDPVKHVAHHPGGCRVYGQALADLEAAEGLTDCLSLRAPRMGEKDRELPQDRFMRVQASFMRGLHYHRLASFPRPPAPHTITFRVSVSVCEWGREGHEHSDCLKINFLANLLIELTGFYS